MGTEVFHYKSVETRCDPDAMGHGPGIEPVIGLQGLKMFICIDGNNRRRHETI